MIELPTAFRTQMQGLLAGDYEAFSQALEADTPVSLRLHPLKKTGAFVQQEAVPWCPEGRYLPERPSFTLDPTFHAGAYYVQEASSMLIDAAFRALFPTDRPLRVLDLCAAPGGKSTLLTGILPKGSWLLANEVIRSRYQILRYNLQKWGYDNTFVSNHDVEDFAGLEGFFDLVLVDAPCSGEGLFRKDQAARQEWSPDNVKLCAARQGRILHTAKKLVAPGGALLYCTCTYNQQENDSNAQWLAAEPELTYESLPFPDSWGLEQRPFGYQAYPHKIQGEGFFLAAFRKKDGPSPKFRARPFRKLQAIKDKDTLPASNWMEQYEAYRFYSTEKGSWRVLNQHLLTDAEILSHHLKRLEVGCVLGEWKGKQLVPSAEWALQLACSNEIPSVEVDEATALEFLRKNTPAIDKLAKGWALVQHQGLNLGWVKGLGKRYNNYYPKNWRIRMA